MEIKFRAWNTESKIMTGWDWLKDAQLPLPPKYPQFVLMQFTGLKDKNKVDIYEGDIIAQRGQANTYVEYEKGKWVLRNDEGDVEWRQELHNKFYLHLEIIGNIYENKELLNP